MKYKHIVDRFELLTRQQIKNHNDALLAHNVAVDQTRNDIVSIRSHIDLYEKKVFSEICASNNEIRNVNLRCIARIDSLGSRLHDLERSNKVISNCENANAKAIERLHERICEVEPFFSRMESMCFRLSERINSFESEISRFHDFIDSRIKIAVGNLRCEMKMKPCDLVELEKNVQSEIRSHTVDVKGVHETIEKFRKAHFIQEKHVEDLYNKLSRLKKSVDNSAGRLI